MFFCRCWQGRPSVINPCKLLDGGRQRCHFAVDGAVLHWREALDGTGGMETAGGRTARSRSLVLFVPAVLCVFNSKPDPLRPVSSKLFFGMHN
jgi:hypothetical protein